MKIQPKLTQTPQLTNKIVMTPKLQQAIKVLMMPQLELQQFIEQELELNPLLDIEEDEETFLSQQEYDPATEWNNPEVDLNRVDPEVDIDWNSLYDDTPVINQQNVYEQSDLDSPEPDIAESITLHEFLYQQLDLAPLNDNERAIGELIIGNLNDDGELQLKLFTLPYEFKNCLLQENISDELKNLINKNLSTTSINYRNTEIETNKIEYQIETVKNRSNSTDNIEPNTWMIKDVTNKLKYTIKDEGTELNLYQLTLEDIASSANSTLSDVESVLTKIQETFEPVGIAYRDLKETLMIQITHLEVQHHKFNGGMPLETKLPFHLAKIIVEDHLDELLNGRILNIAQELELDRSDIQKVTEFIGTLSPYPGRYFTDPNVKDLIRSPETIQGITPDVRIVEFDDHNYILTMDNYFPRLRINPHYINLMRDEDNTVDDETKNWILKKYNDATDLLSSITQRGRTLERVTEAIFKVQSEFLTNGPESIKPLTLKTIAEMADVHESTVSRVTSNKYVQTPIGTFPLKFFFSNQLPTTQGKSVSAKQVKAEIREMIRKENPAKPLSDQSVSAALKEKGIVVARRTVQKYREELGILSSRQRKET
ncbi:RNA polymerase sigma-54 factor [Candidatus Poribacteria bacterium]|nr:MAG: RNA polymerase sigma-54 factor [Candidatus Poribacteria bacterium]